VSPPLSAPATRSEFSLGHRPELDGFRGVSILLVLGLHFVPAWFPGGFIGVDIFFVLSGFLITSLLLQEWSRRQLISLKDFYMRRVLRLAPALLTFLLLFGIYALVFARANVREIYFGILLTLVYVTNWVIAFKPEWAVSVLAITWSLAVEEQFYLFWPLLLLLLLKLKFSRRWLLTFLVLCFVAVGVHRLLLWEAGATVRRLYYATDTHADGLLMGCVIACLLSGRVLPQSGWFKALSKLLGLVAALFIGYFALYAQHESAWLYAWGYSLESFAIAVTLIVLLMWPRMLPAALLRFWPLAWVGRISYGLYLWHWPVREFVFGTAQPSTRQVILSVLISFTIATLSFYLIERPFLAWKKRFRQGPVKEPANEDQTALTAA
jgi:peptidoglycan/LPS O-acetylase OafA/YrhL